MGEEDWSNLDEQNLAQELKNLETKRKKVYLWGEWDPASQTWIETLIPRRLKYPVQTQEKRVCLVIEEWINDSGKPLFSRYVQLESERPEEDAKK